MSSVHLFELILLLMALVIPLELLARRVSLPPAAALILGGMALATAPGPSAVELDPDLTMVLFLPPLLLASAFFTAWRDFRANMRIIAQLAIGAVAFTTLVVGVVTHLVMPALPWAACFALGAIVSPPDAVAAKAVLQRVALPPRVVVLLEGESLVNDASGLVLFRIALAAGLTGSFSAGQAFLSFGILSIGGAVAGLGFGIAATFLLCRLRDANLAIVGSLLAAWASYIGAEAVGVSGVLSTVTCGLVLGHRQHSFFSAVARTNARAVWAVVVFVLESLVFILIGLSLRGVIGELESGAVPVGPLILPVVAVIAAVILSRFAWIVPATYVPRLLFPRLRRRDPYPPWSVPVIMSWAGMRGVVSLAAALALPDAFPGREFILIATFAVILVTVLGQGTTLAPLIRRLRLDAFAGGAAETLPESAARLEIARAQLATVEALARDTDGTVRHPRLLDQYTYRADASRRYHEAAGQLMDARESHFDIILAAIASGRAELLRLHRDARIHDRVLHALEQELDLEEMTARRHRGEAGET